jgi:hypothetical protein
MSRMESYGTPLPPDGASARTSQDSHQVAAVLNMTSAPCVSCTSLFKESPDILLFVVQVYVLAICVSCLTLVFPLFYGHLKHLELRHGDGENMESLCLLVLISCNL